MRTWADAQREAVYYRRLGRLMHDPIAATMYISEGCRIAKSWRTTFGFYLARALRWPRVYSSRFGGRP